MKSVFVVLPFSHQREDCLLVSSFSSRPHRTAPRPFPFISYINPFSHPYVHKHQALNTPSLLITLSLSLTSQVLQLIFTMAKAGLSAASLLLFLFNFCLRGAYGDYGGGWEGGHATFYGGGDASGTMGKFRGLCHSSKKE